MMSAVNGYYNGTNIVLDEEINLVAGQRVIVTIIGDVKAEANKHIDLSQFLGRGEKMFHTDAQEYVRGLRDNAVKI